MREGLQMYFLFYFGIREFRFASFGTKNPERSEDL